MNKIVMFNRVKFVVNKILFQSSKKRGGFQNKKYNDNKNFNNVSIRKFSCYCKHNNYFFYL